MHYEAFFLSIITSNLIQIFETGASLVKLSYFDDDGLNNLYFVFLSLMVQINDSIK